MGAAVLATPAVTAATAGAGANRKTLSLTALRALDAQILARLNTIRAARGLRALRQSARLAAAAARHSREMATSGLFQHESPDGSSFAKRIQRFYPRPAALGETLLWWSPDAGATAIVDEWLSSPEHREILLDPSYREVGVSAVHDTAAPGDFEGLEATIVTADFGSRRR
jgi:uncharacterized protein YkwD